MNSSDAATQWNHQIQAIYLCFCSNAVRFHSYMYKRNTRKNWFVYILLVDDV